MGGRGTLLRALCQSGRTNSPVVCSSRRKQRSGWARAGAAPTEVCTARA